MKKKIAKYATITILLITCTVSVYAYSFSGVYGGPGNISIAWEWWTGWNVNGDYTESVATNRSGQAAYAKQVYARSGTDGSYSEWKSSGTQEARVKDSGPYGTSDYAADAYWDYD